MDPRRWRNMRLDGHVHHPQRRAESHAGCWPLCGATTDNDLGFRFEPPAAWSWRDASAARDGHGGCAMPNRACLPSMHSPGGSGDLDGNMVDGTNHWL
uniref:Uncharacterized protein n=1 Tax=Setaria viridis TaxID=4556 RepID=A0A4U6VQ85_SETVI|nr:hypothetical protein SEVIR_2G075400v2 [Setaria viridis]